MNWKQLLALVKLRIRLSANQIKKAGRANVILSVIMSVCIGLGSLSAFFIGLIGGSFWFPEISVTTLLITWNIIIAAFLFVWCIGLLAELQQTELMSISKLLHLPLSLREAYLLNYTSSFFNASCLMFVPGMIGVSLGMAIARGWTMLIALLLTLAFLFCITAVTYQFRGWLAGLLENKRRRGTIIAVMTIGFVGLLQTPHLVTYNMDKWEDAQREKERTGRQSAIEKGIALIGMNQELDQVAGVESRIPNGVQIDWMIQEVDQEMAQARAAAKIEQQRFVIDTLRTANSYFPPGWVPLGIANAAEGRFWPSLLAVGGFAGIGLLSLQLGFRSCVRRYQGVSGTRGKRKPVAAATSKATASYADMIPPKAARLRESMFRKIPFVSEQASSIAVASTRSLLRAPEVRISFILPLLVIIGIATIYFFKSDFSSPPLLLPLIPLAIIAFGMFSISGIIFNTFGMDRDGFRAFVLAPVERREILLAKNIGLAPLAIGLPVFQIALLQFLFPQSTFGLLAAVVQTASVYVIFCAIGNVASIFFPMGLKRGTAQPVNTKFIPIMIMLLSLMIGPSICLLPTTIALAIPVAISLFNDWEFGSLDWLYLLLSLIQLGGVLWLYWTILKPQGSWLWRREPRILADVANVPE